MLCQIRDDLYTAYKKASLEYHTAIRKLGDCAPDEHTAQVAAVEAAWEDCCRIRRELHAHSEKHGCGAGKR